MKTLKPKTKQEKFFTNRGYKIVSVMKDISNQYKNCYQMGKVILGGHYNLIDPEGKLVLPRYVYAREEFLGEEIIQKLTYDICKNEIQENNKLPINPQSPINKESDREIEERIEKEYDEYYKSHPELWKTCERCGVKSSDVSHDIDRYEDNCSPCYEKMEGGGLLEYKGNK